MRLLKTLFLCILPMFVIGQDLNTSILTQRLLDQVEADPNEIFDISILLNDQVDAWSMHLDFHDRGLNQQERVSTLLPLLKAKAASTQGAILDLLEQSPQDVQQESIRPFWITNIIFAKVNKSMLTQLSNRDDVELLDWNAPLELEKVTDEGPAPPVEPNDIEPGLAAIKAPALWAMGYTGYGTLSFISDTGVDPTHPAIWSQYWGHYKEDSEAWFEYQGANNGPYDCGDHGTHVAGTVQGLNRPTSDTTGVAYNAQWIGGAILCGIGTADNIAAFQWALDPDNDDNTVDDMPDVINNSWRDSSLDDDCNNAYVNVLSALEAVGVAVVFSAGNEGSGASTITPPKNINLDLVHTFAVGALNANTTNFTIAGFSSRGPSVCGGDSSLLIKPEVSAPGVSVRSCVPDGGYGLKSGTSMASPHVAGAILLLKEAFPDLMGYELKEALYFTCTDLGDVGEDNTFGMGIINVEEAFNYLVDLGNDPVSPLVENDVHLFRLDLDEFQCGQSIFGRAMVENAGTENLTSFDISITLEDGSSWSDTWTGELEPGQRAWVNIGPLPAALGTERIIVETSMPNLVEDLRPLNNRLTTEVEVSDRELLDAFVAQGPGMVACEGGEVLLKANYSGNGTVEVNWYDAVTDGNLLGTGQAFSLSGVVENTTVYAEATYWETVGMESYQLGEYEFGEDVAGRGLVFDAYKPFTLRTVKVNAEATGAMIVELANSNGETITQRVVVISEVGENIVNVDMLVPVGNNHELKLQVGVSLAYSNSGQLFPYEIEDIVRIKQSNFPGGAAGLGRYYFFYDWGIEYDEFCSRTPVDIPFSDVGLLPTAAFSASNTLLDLDNSDGMVSFTDQSENAVQWYWDFGDGNTSEEQNPTHTYTTPGIYQATLTVANADGCSANSIIQIEAFVTPVSNVTSLDLQSFAFDLYPNPASEIITVAWKASDALSNGLNLQIVDLLGRQTLVQSVTSPGNTGSVELNVQSLTNGVYWLVASDGSQQWTRKLVIAR